MSLTNEKLKRRHNSRDGQYYSQLLDHLAVHRYNTELKQARVGVELESMRANKEFRDTKLMKFADSSGFLLNEKLKKPKYPKSRIATGPPNQSIDGSKKLHNLSSARISPNASVDRIPHHLLRPEIEFEDKLVPKPVDHFC